MAKLLEFLDRHTARNLFRSSHLKFGSIVLMRSKCSMFFDVFDGFDVVRCGSMCSMCSMCSMWLDVFDVARCVR